MFCCDTVPSFLPLGSSTSQSMRMLCLPPLASAKLYAALNHIDVDRGAVGELNAAGIEPLLQGRGQRPLAVARGARHRGDDHAGGPGACHAGGRGRRRRGRRSVRGGGHGAGRAAAARQAGGELRGGLAGDAADRRTVDAAPRIAARARGNDLVAGDASDARALGVVDVPNIGDVRSAASRSRRPDSRARCSWLCRRRSVASSCGPCRRQPGRVVMSWATCGVVPMIGATGDLGRAAEPARGPAQQAATARRARTATAAGQGGKRTGGERYECDTPEPAAHVSCVRAQQNTPSVGRTAPLATDMS